MSNKMTFLPRLRDLHGAGVLGLNRRNAEYTLRYNPRNRYPLVDDKLLTKSVARSTGLKVPELYAVITAAHETRSIVERLASYEDFVVKPARGSGGKGILVISDRAGPLYRKVDGELLTENQLRFHLSNILSGMYSLGGQPDRAMIEYRVRFDPIFESISFQGVPDIRIIVFLGVPVMAMVRLPTNASGGRANLHQGAVGAGIDMAKGLTLTAVSKNRIITRHPDTGAQIQGVPIPFWNTLMNQAASCYELTGIGYLGVDMVIDRGLGPLILELNARPGLSIQIANRTGLLKRLAAVEAIETVHWTAEERAAYARSTFGTIDSR